MRVRTRFAPSPTGELHLGNARTAVLNWLFARHHDGDFVLRFEDTDIERNVTSAEERILEGLDWLGLERDEDPVVGGPHAPYRQSRRTERYRWVAQELLAAGHAFRCYCTSEELEARRAASPETGGQLRRDERCRALGSGEEAALRAEGRVPAIRFRAEPGPVGFRDRVAGQVEIDAADLGDFVLLRSDGRPTYNFAAVVDDLEMEITHVIRGAGHLSNTPKQVLLYRALGAAPPEFVHVPVVLAPGGGKLSKRGGARGLLAYRDEGLHPHAVVNYLSLLSWSPPDGREVLSPEELVRDVDLDRLGGQNVEIAPEKLRWLSGQHVRRETPASLARRLRPWVAARGLELSDRELEALAELVRERVHLFSEAAEEAVRIFGPPDLEAEPAARALEAPGAAGVLRAALAAWEEAGSWEAEEIAAGMEEALRRSGERGRAFYLPLRVALTGQAHGPGLPAVARVLGRERTLARLRAALEAVAAEAP